MLARLQRIITLTLLLLALAYAVFALRAGSPLAAAAGVLLIVGGYAGILALEFMMLGWSSRRLGPPLRATLVQLVKAWCGEVLMAPVVFCWRQPFRSALEPDCVPDAGAAGSADCRRGVVLVHGFVCNRGVWTPVLRALRERGIPFIAVNLEPVFGSIDAYPGVIDAAVRRLAAATGGRAPVVVAHSMGGLAVRAWLSSHGDDGRAHRVITVASPHHGTLLARFSFSPNAAQMRLGSAWLKRLAANEPPRRFACFTCFYGHCDNIVFPIDSATLPGADNRHLPECAHVHMAQHPAVLDEILRWAQEPPGAAPSAPPLQPGSKQASPASTTPASISDSALTER